MDDGHERVHRVTVRGRFRELTSRRTSTCARPGRARHLRVRLHPEGTFTYDDRIQFFNLRYEIRCGGDDPAGLAAVTGEVEAETFLRTMGFGHGELKVDVVDVSAIWDDVARRRGGLTAGASFPRMPYDVDCRPPSRPSCEGDAHHRQAGRAPRRRDPRADARAGQERTHRPLPSGAATGDGGVRHGGDRAARPACRSPGTSSPRSPTATRSSSTSSGPRATRCCRACSTSTAAAWSRCRASTATTGRGGR